MIHSTISFDAALIGIILVCQAECSGLLKRRESPFEANFSASLSTSISEIVSGPLKNHWVVFLLDGSAETFLDLKQENVLTTGHPLSIYKSNPDWDWHEFLPPNPTLQGRCAAVLITGMYPQWIDEITDSWVPDTLLIINVNYFWKSSSLLKSPKIQQVTSLALLEDNFTGHEAIPIVYTTPPFIKVHTNKTMVKELLGSWNASMFITKGDLFPDRFKTFKGEVLHVASDYDDYPLVFGDDNGLVDGTNIRILSTLAVWLNFSFTTTNRSVDNSWGELINGTWIGMLGEVFRGSKNITINYFTVVEDRAKDFDYTAPYFYEGFGFALLIPPPLPMWMSLLYPFTNWVWTSVIAAIIVITPTLYLLAGLADPENKLSLMKASLTIFGSLLVQNVKAPSNNVVRLILAFWWVGGLILVVSYTSNLIAVLTVPAFPPKITTIKGLAKSNYRVSMINYGEFVPEALATSQDQYLKILGKRLDLVPNYSSSDVSYDKLLDLLFAGTHSITETYSYLRNLLRNNVRAKGKTYVLREQIYPGALAFFVNKNTPWKGKFDVGIQRLVEAGLVNKWYNDIMEDNTGQLAIQPSSVKERPLNIANLQGAFLILALGLTMTLIIFLAEYGYTINQGSYKG
ncbi:probable glutamate receptor [Macrobrachium rosenbergii]|uniref:probable glutamate receptor n=1 Tax=Macrobrachium rosenbergii TaxID=79674 RepID=UPI0034D4C60B